MSNPIDIDHRSSKEEEILRMTYDRIDCMSPGEADNWADSVFDIDYDSDRDLKQKLKLEVTRFKSERRSSEERGIKTGYKHILDEEQKKREKLVNQLQHFEKSVDKLLRISNQSSKNQTIGKIHDMTIKFKAEKEEYMKDFLKVKPNPIFITGETSSGKSSFINLLLNDDIMPVDFERSSSTFCVISKSSHPYKRAEVYFKNPPGKKEIIENLPEKEFNTKCQKYLASRNNDIKYVELMTNSDILRDDVVIMDSPGMGDPDFAASLKEKIQSACAFVYILKHFNPIGEDCQEIADIVKNAIRGWREQVDYDSMVFVINKWDTVQKDKDETMKSICKRLKKFMKGLSEKRVIPMSVRDAIFMQKQGVRADDYNEFLKLLHSLQISSITNKTRKFHTLVVNYMTGILDALTLLEYKLNTALEERKRKANDLDLCRVRINTALNDYVTKKRIQFEDCVKERTRTLIHLMKDEEDMRNIFKGLMSRVMPFAITPNEMDIQIADFASKKLSSILEAQEQKDKYFYTISEDLLKDFLEKFSEFEATLQQSQRDLFAGHTLGILGKEKTLVERAMPEWSRLSKKQKIIFGVSMPLYIPIFIGACVVSLNMKFISMIKDHWSSPTQMVSIDGRREYVIKKSLQLYDRYVKKEEYIRQYVEENMKGILDTLECLQKAAMEQLENLRIDAKVLREDSQCDRQLISDAKELRQKFHMYLSGLYQFEFECLHYERVLPETLFEYENPKRPITSSTNSAIYGVTAAPMAMPSMEELGHTNRAALKRIFWQVMVDDVQSLHTEIQLSIQHSNASRLLRMTRVVKSPVNAEQINVSLLCEAVLCSLRSMVYEKTPRMVPATKYSFLYETFEEINRALSFLHSCKVKHGDGCTYLTGFELNLDTIVVTARGDVKLSNLKLPDSVAIPKVVDCQDGVHAFRHISPDVLLQKRPYNVAADMYSVAIAMYEAWFHTEAFLEFTFDRDNPKNTISEYANQLNDPVMILEKQVERNGMNTNTKTKGQLQGANLWFDGVRQIIEAYKEENPKLIADEWINFVQKP